MKTVLLFLFSLLAAEAFAGDKEDRFVRRLRALHEARDIEGLLSLVEFGDGDTPRMIRDSKRKSFEAVSKSKVTSVTVQEVTDDEAKDFAAPFEHEGVTYVPTLSVVAKVVIAFEDQTPGPAKVLSVAQPLGVKDGEFRMSLLRSTGRFQSKKIACALARVAHL
jgi:hypothetical protein